MVKQAVPYSSVSQTVGRMAQSNRSQGGAKLDSIRLDFTF